MNIIINSAELIEDYKESFEATCNLLAENKQDIPPIVHDLLVRVFKSGYYFGADFIASGFFRIDNIEDLFDNKNAFLEFMRELPVKDK